MTTAGHDEIVAQIREHGPLTAAEFIDLALYHPAYGYYASSGRRSGGRGDFYSSVDVGPLFGELVAVQIAEMRDLLVAAGADRFDLVEAGAGDGRLARDILDACAAHHQNLYQQVRVTLVERSPAARTAQRTTLSSHVDRIVDFASQLPRRITGIMLANELLDALPVHVLVMTEDGPREIYVGEQNGALVEIADDPSDQAIWEYLTRFGIDLESCRRVEVGLEAERWISEAATRLERGFLLLFDYGHEAAELYSSTHAGGTLTAYRRHTAGAAHWLSDPGQCDLTTHVNLTSVRQAAEDAGLIALGCVDQTYFMMALGITERVTVGSHVASLSRRLSAKALIMPGGLGSTIKVMAFGKNVGQPALRGFTNGRLT